jgi:Arc/MetJ-type ribon-helix-helix transcriptional regulator
MTTQIAVKLPDDLLAAIDRLVDSHRYASRSEIVRAGLLRVITDDAAQTVDDAFTRGVAQHPDSDDDVRRATSLAIESIADEPWEKWW